MDLPYSLGKLLTLNEVKWPEKWRRDITLFFFTNNQLRNEKRLKGIHDLRKTTPKSSKRTCLFRLRITNERYPVIPVYRLCWVVYGSVLSESIKFSDPFTSKDFLTTTLFINWWLQHPSSPQSIDTMWYVVSFKVYLSSRIIFFILILTDSHLYSLINILGHPPFEKDYIPTLNLDNSFWTWLNYCIWNLGIYRFS